MKLPDYEREDAGDLEELNNFLQEVAEKTGAQSNPSIQPLIDRMTRQVEFITQALSGRLNAGDNFNSDIKRISFEQNVPKTVRSSVSGQVTDVRIRQTFPRQPFLSPRALDWETISTGEIRVVMAWATDPGQPVDVEIVIEGD